MTNVPAIGPSSQVRLHLAIYLEDGTEVLSSLDGEPLELRIGDGTLAPGLEALMHGLRLGADEQFLVDGSTIFGEYEPGRCQRLARADLPDDFSPDPGQVIQFATPGGQETTGTVVSSDANSVEIDFNHPLSRRSLRIRLKVVGLF